MNQLETLVVVNPGSLFGEAESKAGLKVANSVRENIYHEIFTHKGNLVVVDTPLSDEVDCEFESLLANGYSPGGFGEDSRLRLWVGTNSYHPYRWWRSAGFSNHTGVFADYSEAAEYVSMRFGESPITVTGGWTAGDNQSSAIDQFAEGLHHASGSLAAQVSQWALHLDQIQPDFGPILRHPARQFGFEILV